MSPPVRAARKAMPYLHPRHPAAHAGEHAPAELLSRLSGADAGESLRRLGRATRHQRLEYGATIHPLSGRITSMVRGDAKSVRAPAEPVSRAGARLREIAATTKRPDVRLRAKRAVSAGKPEPVHVHTHPRGVQGYPSSVDLLSATHNLRGGTVLAREGKLTRVTHYRPVDGVKTKLSAHHLAQGSLTVDARAVGPGGASRVGYNQRSKLVKRYSAFGIVHKTAGVAELTGEQHRHISAIHAAVDDSWGGPGKLAGAVHGAHKAGVPHELIAHHARIPLAQVKIMAGVR